MTICEFCGKEIPDGGICDCAESVEAAEEAVFEEEDTVDEDAYGEDADSGGNSIIDEINADNEENVEAAEEVNALDFLDSAPRPVHEDEEEYQPQPAVEEREYRSERPAPQPAAPVRRRKRRTKAVMRRRRLAALAVIVLFFTGCSFIRNHTGYRGAVNRYWNCVVDKDGGTDYYSLGLPRVLIKHFKDTGEWENLIGNYQSLSERAVKLKRIKKKKRMTKDELRDAEEYLYNLARIYGAKTADGEIIADKGYFVTVVYKFGDDKILGGAYYVKIEGDGWKVLPHDMDT